MTARSSRLLEINLPDICARVVAVEEKHRMETTHKERLYKCQSAPHKLPRTEQQNQEERKAFEKRKRDEVFRYDKQVSQRLDGKVRVRRLSPILLQASAHFYAAMQLICSVACVCSRRISHLLPIGTKTV